MAEGRTYGEIKLEEARKDVADILTDRWSLDQEDGWDEFGEETLDDIVNAFRPLFLDSKVGLKDG